MALRTWHLVLISLPHDFQCERRRERERKKVATTATTNIYGKITQLEALYVDFGFFKIS